MHGLPTTPRHSFVSTSEGGYGTGAGEAVTVAGSIVEKNFESTKELGKEGALLMISAPYWDIEERGLAVVGAEFHADVARAALAPFAERLRLHTLIGVTNMQTMKFEVLDERKA